MADLYRSSRTMCVRETQIIPPRPHEIVVSDGVSIFVKEREIKTLPLYRIRMVAGGDLLGG